MKNKSQHNMGGTLGAVVASAIAGATAVALSNKSTRDKLKKTLTNAIDRGNTKLDELNGKVGEVKTKTKKRVLKELKKAEQKLI